MTLHAGEVYYDEHGVTGASINLAFRLLDARDLKGALARSAGVLAIIASSWFYEEVVRHTAMAIRRFVIAGRITIGHVARSACCLGSAWPLGRARRSRLVM
jgi:ribosomal protein L2